MKRLGSFLATHGHLQGGLFSKLWPFPAVIGSTVLIAWATEVAAFFISRGLALAILAFLQVSPEFAVEAVLARNAARNPSQLQFVTANFTGSNRLLVGAGLPIVFLIGRYALKRRDRWPGYLPIAGHHSLEVVVLGFSSMYSLLWVIRGGLGLIDTVVLATLFAFYLFVLWRMPSAEEGDIELLRGTPRRVMERKSRRFQGRFAVGAFLVGGTVLFLSAEPFVKGMKDMGVYLGVPAYLLLQWVAPLLSEFPEFFTATYWSRQGRAEQAFMNMTASILSQRTLLIAMIPLVFTVTHAIEGKNGFAIRFDYQQRIEILLTAAQAIFAAVAMCKFRFLRWEAYALLGLWAFQLFDPVIDPLLQHLPSLFGGTDPQGRKIIIREYTTVVFFVLTAVDAWLYRKDFRVVRHFRSVWHEFVSPQAEPSA
jgi:cation:H+ antiporter